MKYLPILIATLFAFDVSAETIVCEAASPSAEPTFEAKFDIFKEDGADEIDITSLSLSKPWPLAPDCDSPKLGQKLVGYTEGKETKASVPHPKECGFTFYLRRDGGEFSGLLSPRQNYKVWGHTPYVSTCKGI